MRNTASSEYLSNASEAQQNSNGNGQHKPKIFELAPVKGPEEAQRDFVREIAPKIRRRVHFDGELSPGAKFLFDALLDLSFMNSYGGSGNGKLFTTVKDLSRLLKHDRKSICSWRDELVKPRWIWVREQWPICEWRICALCPAPETDANVREYQMTLGKAEGKGEGKVSPTPQNGHSPSKVQETDNSDPKDSPRRGEPFPTQSGNLTHDVGNLSPESCPKAPHDMTKDSPRRGEPMVTDVGKFSPQRGEGLDNNKETPREIRSNGARRGGEAPPNFAIALARWEKGLEKKFDRELREILAELTAEQTRIKELADEQTKTHGKAGPNTTEKLSRLALKIKAVKARLHGP